MTEQRLILPALVDGREGVAFFSYLDAWLFAVDMLAIARHGAVIQDINTVTKMKRAEK